MCLKATPVGRRACDTCNSKGVKSTGDQCAVCHVRVSGGSRRIYTESEAKEANELVNSYEGTAVFESLRRGKTGDAMQFTEWKEYCAHVTKHFIVESCARGGAKAARHPEVILCLDKRSMVPPVKAFAHAKRLGGGGAVSNGNQGGPKRGKGGKGKGVELERIWTDNIPKFDLRGRPPR